MGVLLSLMELVLTSCCFPATMGFGVLTTLFFTNKLFNLLIDLFKMIKF